MGTLGGILLVVLIVVVAGLIAYVGDRVGHQVGRRRLTLFGLRPKYTSTIVAVGTGMTIAFVATVVPLLTTPLARDAFFHLSEINNRVNELQAQADALQKQTRESNIVINRGQLLYNQFLLITPQESNAERQRRIATFFDAIVASLNRTYGRSGLKPFKGSANDPEIKKKLDDVLADQRVAGFLLRGPVLLVAVADENLFPNDPISFTFAPYSDVPVFHAKQAIASIEIDGGTTVNPYVAYAQLAAAISDTAIASGMPAYFANAIPSAATGPFFATADRTVRAGRGRYYIVARAAADVYPHTGGIPVVYSLSRTPT
jgi:hypothetical protein